MATLSSSTTTHTPLNTSFLLKSSQLSSFKNQSHFRRSAPSCKKVSCKTNKNEDELQPIQNPKNNTPLSLDRRNMLIGLGGMYGAAITLGGGSTNTLAAPIAPDVTACTLTDAQWDNSVGDHCCPPKFDPSKIVDFDFKNYPSPIMKVRRPAHKAMLDNEWLADYKRATAIMKSLPLSDPRNFMQQARVHCAYCDGAYPVLDHPDQRLEVHASWLFASFHRWYLYFFERIMAKLINKPGFALPYWNWDHPDGMRIPEMFKDIDSPLYDPNRNVNHLSRVIDLSFNNVEHDYPDEKQIQENLLLMRKQMLYPTKPSVFFGAAYRSGDAADPNAGAGALELSPHNNVHIWTGSKTIRSNQDMGAFWSAGRDSIFYCHHSNVDRMWSIWRNDLPGRSRLDLNDPDYLNAYFIFYDENANPVKVYVKDSFDTEKLGYKYEQQDLPWLFKSVATPAKPTITDTTVTFPKALDSVIKTKVERPRKSRTKDEKEEQEEVLLINLELGMSQEFIKFDVYVNDDSEHNPGEKTVVKPQYAGSYTSLTHRGAGSVGKLVGGAVRGMAGMAGMGGGKSKKSGLRLAITKLLEDIGASEDEAIQVTIVPISGSDSVVIGGVSIQYVA
ncbi:hypothetical protein BVRB_6g136680 [Beta vulgaris subsp. vulgaris]|nr:hypothetical protein BVRB_6g136680 [Beta vulgaris subsp. vulgaris]